MSNSYNDAVPGPSKTEDGAVPGPSKTEDDAVPVPSNAEEDAVPDPSKETGSKIINKVSFSQELLSSSAERVRSKYRKASMIGTAGYVSQLVEGLEKEESVEALDEKDLKPIRMQSIEERRSSIKQVETDIGNYMKSVARKSIDEKKSTSRIQIPTIGQERLGEIAATSDVKIDASTEDRLSSEWLPSQALGSAEARAKTERSWVGTYVVGKDYWNDVEEEEDEKEKEERRARYTVDDVGKTWYDMPVPKTSRTQEATYLEHKKETLKKIEELKDDIDKEFRYKREQRSLLAAAARSTPKPFEEWTDNFKLNFKEVAKQGEFSHLGTHLSMANADKWLENAAILDHRKLTLIHTGFCFLASGGSRNRGLSFTEFTHFLEMISYTNGMPLRDITKRLEVCLRRTSPAVS